MYITLMYITLIDKMYVTFKRNIIGEQGVQVQKTRPKTRLKIRMRMTL